MKTYVKEVHLISAPSGENSNYALYVFSFVFRRVWTAAQIAGSHALANQFFTLFQSILYDQSSNSYVYGPRLASTICSFGTVPGFQKTVRFRFSKGAETPISITETSFLILQLLLWLCSEIAMVSHCATRKFCALNLFLYRKVSHLINFNNLFCLIYGVKIIKKIIFVKSVGYLEYFFCCFNK